MRIAYVDGAALDLALGEFASALGVTSVPFDYNAFFINIGAERVFYYDALPSKKKGEEPEVFASRLAEKSAKIDSLRMVPRTVVRLGETTGENNQRQKGVDVLLATEALRHAFDKVSNQATFVVSDLDFFPVFETLVHTHVTSVLFYRVGHTSDKLLQIASFATPLTQSLLLRSCDNSFASPRLPSERPEHGPLSDEEKASAIHGVHEERDLFLWNNPPNVCCWWSGIRSQAPTRELVLERWIPSTRTEIVFSDGWVYRAKSK